MEAIRQDSKVTGAVIMVVSGDPELIGTTREQLEGPAIQVIVPESAAESPARAKVRQPQLVLLDVDKPDAPATDGTPLLEAFKNSPYTSPVPVIVLVTPGAGENARLELFRRGADDVVSRPDNTELLQRKISALGKRYAAPEAQPETLEAEGLLLDLRARKVTVNGSPVALTRKEFDLLNMLLRKRGLVAYTTHLYHTVWGYGESSPVDSHTVKVHISSLRSKLGPALGRRIVNLPGLGYRFDD